MILDAPNFVIIGAQKAGTTSPYHSLRQHPAVFMSAVTEPRFFSHLANAEAGVAKPGDRAVHTLQIGMGWFPEQAGGLNRVYYHLIRSLPQAGVGVRGLVMGSPDVARQTEGQVEAVAPENASLLVRAQQLRRRALAILADQETDLVAGHFALYAAPLGRHLRRRPLVVHFHGPWAHEGSLEGDSGVATRIKGRIERSVYRQARRFIVLSEAFRDVLHRRYGIPLERIRIVPGGVAVERFSAGPARAEARRRLGWTRERPIILTVRRLQRRMGLENLISAMATVRRAVPEALLLIAGRGPLAAELDARIEALDLHDHVRLLGFLPDDALPLAYRAADLTIVPTVALEGFGLITIESLAAGTPVLVTPVGGLPETVRTLSPSLILEGVDTDALTDGLVQALRGTLPLPDESTCQTYARTHYAWPVLARRIRAVYEEALR